MVAKIVITRKGQSYRVTLMQEGFDRTKDTVVTLKDSEALGNFLADPAAVSLASVRAPVTQPQDAKASGA